MPDPRSDAGGLDAVERPPWSDDEFGRELVTLQPRVRGFVANLQRGERSSAGGLTDGVEDVVQEALTRAWRSRSTFDPERGDVDSWIMRIAFRAFLDFRRQSRADGALDRPVPDVRPGPERHASAREEADGLLSMLTERERDVLLQFHRDGQRVHAIAASLGVPSGTVKSLLHRARERLWAAVRQRQQDDQQETR